MPPTNKNFLLPWPKDERDLKLSGIFDQPFLSELPEEFVLDGWGIYNQKDSDFCSRYALGLLEQIMEGIVPDKALSFALSKLLSGGVEEFGQDLKSAATVDVKYGVVPEKELPYSLENKPHDFLRRIENWGDISNYLNTAAQYQKASYVSTHGRFKPFDNFRTWIWKFRDEKRAITTGVVWGWDNQNPLIDTIPQNGSGHAVPIVGWTKHYLTNGKIDPSRPFPDGKTRLVVPNSWGEYVGDNGVFYFGEEPINHFVDIYGGLMFKDITPERARFLQENGLKQDGAKLWELIVPLWKRVYSLLAELAAELFITKYNEPIEPKVEPVKTPSQLLLEKALECEGKDMAKTQNALGCAEALNAVHKLAFGTEIGGTTSTYRLYQAIRIDPTFQKVTEPMPGDIIISPTGYQAKGGTILNGHCGIVCEEDAIISNNSKTFKWDKNFTLFSWKLFYGKKGQFPIFFFRKVV